MECSGICSCVCIFSISLFVAPVFLPETSADSFLSRSLLYNSWDFELVTAGDLERECKEEICSYEEAREVFENDQMTVRDKKRDCVCV